MLMINWRHFAEQWRTFKDRLLRRWSYLTMEDVQEIGGDEQRLVAKLKERYGYSTEEAVREVQHWRTEQHGED